MPSLNGVDEIEQAYARRYGGFRRPLAALHADDELAHDAVQEGFARALRKRSQFRGGSLDAWLWRIVRYFTWPTPSAGRGGAD